jgi:hypothetical protein
MVIGSKLRRHEGFFFSWKEDAATGTGRGSIWVSPAVPLTFAFDLSERTSMNHAWLEALAVSANSPHGLAALAEPCAPELANDSSGRQESVSTHSDRTFSRRSRAVGF